MVRVASGSSRPRPRAPEPEKTVARPRSAKTNTAENQKVRDTEWRQYVDGPGTGMNIKTGKRYAEVRESLEGPPIPYQGVHAAPGRTRVDDIRNPGRADGRWDPLQHMPRMVFDSREDAFPVSPSFDGNASLKDNRDSYRDGVIGGNQRLSSAFSVSRKGDYTVLTWNQYYAHNKAANYHDNDYSTMQVYLKRGKDGALQPEYLATSTHHGSQLTKWNDLKKDADGRPVVQVHLGSHALQPLGKDQAIPKAGLHITGRGTAELDGKPLQSRLALEGFQENVDGIRPLDPRSDEGRTRLKAMAWGSAAMDPFLPDVFQENAHHKHLADVEKRVKRAAGSAGRKARDVAEDVGDVAGKGARATRRAARDAVQKVRGWLP